MKNLFKKSKRFRQDAGIALLTTLLLLFLMSSMLVGFSLLLISNQQLAGSNNDQVHAFYGAEAGMEKLTAGLGDLFAQTYSPSAAQINTLESTPPVFTDITFMTGDGHSGYLITPAFTDALGNPKPTITTIKAGTYNGMTAMATEYTLTVNARTVDGREVKLQRTTQTVGIPMFQFGIFSDTDLSFFPGPNFNFGGRTHTNGNLFLAAGSTLTLSDKVDAYEDVIRTNLSNGWPTSNGYTGTVNITTQPGGSTYRALAPSEGSLTGTLGSSFNINWPNISRGATNYNGNLLNGKGSAYPASSTGASMLNLGIVTIGSGTTQSIDLLRRANSGESANLTAERYYAQASLRVLVSDDPTDLMNMPCIDGSTQPFDLKQIAVAPGAAGAGWAGYGPAATLYAKMVANGVTPLPLAASGAAVGAAAYNAADGYWLPNGFPIIKGFLKIEEQTAYGDPCGTWKDVTVEVLSYGYVGRNINPVPQSLDGNTLNPQWTGTNTTMQAGAAPALTNLPGAAYGYQNTQTAFAAGNFTVTSTVAAPKTCMDPHPLAVIRLERIRDNPTSVPVQTGTRKTTAPTNLPKQASVAQVCGVDPATGQLLAGWTPTVYDFWPNVLFDSREGTLRDVSMSAANLPTLNGSMHYIELDGKNLASWFGGKIGAINTSGQGTKDPAVAPNNFLVYISDRRGNYAASQTLTGGWPPLSYTKNESGEYGWTDIVNSPQNPTTGCPNNALDTGEDPDKVNGLFTYGAAAGFIHAPGAGTLTPLLNGQLGIFSTLSSTGLVANGVCPTVPSYSNDYIWPMMLAASPTAARENPPLFFRRTVKIVNGSLLTAVGPCPGSVTCGLAIAAENPIYIQGDYNANSGGNGFNDPQIATSVAGDAVTLLSVQWNDINSFVEPYPNGCCNIRNGITTFYRTAIIGGSTISFPNPTGTGQDYGTDGGVHNFLRYLEAWGGTLNYRGSIINLFSSRQANGTFKCCTTVYSPPTRGYNFDTNFLTPALLPPRTPLFRDVNTTGWTRLLMPNQ